MPRHLLNGSNAYTLMACIVLALSGGACGTHSSAATGDCGADIDCPSGQACITGACQPVDSGSSGGAEAGAGGAAGSSIGDAGAPSSGAGGAAPQCLGRVVEPTAAQHCVCQSDCDADEVCADEATTGLPGGICLKDCHEASCAANDICVELTPGDATTSTCLISCTTTAQCPTGQICQNEVTDGPLFCFPLCQSDADCPALGQCDHYTGACGVPEPGAGPGGIEDACATDDDCQSAFCIPPSATYPGGACTAFCSLSHDGCPTGSTCTANWSDEGDEGICLKSCSKDADCRANYRCGSYAGNPQAKVCAPVP